MGAWDGCHRIMEERGKVIEYHLTFVKNNKEGRFTLTFPRSISQLLYSSCLPACVCAPLLSVFTATPPLSFFPVPPSCKKTLSPNIDVLLLPVLKNN